MALSLVGDSMDMSSMENRTYYHFGLEYHHDIHNIFLNALINAEIGENPYSQRDIAFKITPKLNAVCRSDSQEWKQAIFCAFLGYNISEAIQICEEAHKIQTDTVADIIDNHLDEIKEKNNSHTLIIFANDDIPKSYSGLVCGKVMSLCDNKPSIVGSIKDGYLIGSLRSPIDLRTELNDNELVEFAQGHERSCGVKIKEENIPTLLEQYQNLAYTPQTEVLRSYTVKSMCDRLFRVFEPYTALWGKGLPTPMVEVHNIKVIPSENIKVFGRTIRITVDGVDFMIFNSKKQDKIDLGLGYYEKDTFVSEPKDTPIYLQVIGTPKLNRYKNKVSNQIVIDKYEISCYNRKRLEDLI